MPDFWISPALKNCVLAPKPVRRRDAARQNRVLRDVVVVREVEAESIVEHAGLESELRAEHALGLEIQIAERARRERRLAVRAGDRTQRAKRGVVRRLLTRAAVRGAESQVVDERRQVSLHALRSRSRPTTDSPSDTSPT